VALLSPRTRRRIVEFDAQVDRAFDRLRGNPVADRVFYTASDLGDFSLIWLLLGALRGLRSEHDWHAAVRVGGTLAVESFLVNVGIKGLFRRARPPWDTARPRRLRRPRSSSFPSGHATSAFCAFVLLSEDDPLWPVYLGVAAITAASRVHVKIHHASDVVAGIPVGLAIGLTARRLHPLPVRHVSESSRPSLGST
jgi:undecaprenyl-diphosphatase